MSQLNTQEEPGLITANSSSYQAHDIETGGKIKKSLRFSVGDAGAFAAMFGLTQNYITPYALHLNASTMQVGLIASIPNFVQAVAQLSAPSLEQRAGSRKGIILPVVFVHALSWVPVFLLPYLFPATGVWWLLAFVTVCAVAGAISNPVWGSLMADLVHEDLRGRYFSYRNRVASFVTMVCSFGAGAVLQIFSGNVFIGFAGIFGGAMVFRLVSLFFLSRMWEPPTHPVQNRPGILQIIKGLGKSNLGKFTVFAGLIFFAIMISGPFFTVYMLRDLQFSYLTFSIVISTSTISSLIFLPFWGRRADRAGNIKIIKITSCLLPVIPLLWLFNADPVYLSFANIFSGFAWSGFELAMVNFVYDASEPANRTRQIAVFNSVTGIALCIGALAGGYIAPRLPELFGYQLRTLFTMSGILRAVIAIVLLRTITEVRRVPKIDAFKLLMGKPIKYNGQ